jgi:hypothetical protein
LDTLPLSGGVSFLDMHLAQRQFCERVKSNFPEYFYNTSVLDIGSMDINGNNRYLFTDCNYTGIDLGEGENVDIIAPCGAHTVDLDKTFDVVISTECLEHDKHYLKTLERMVEWCNGLMLFTCATTGRREHGTTRTSPKSSPFTNDYYKNLTIEDIKLDFSIFKDYKFEINNKSKDLYFWGLKYTI